MPTTFEEALKSIGLTPDNLTDVQRRMVAKINRKFDRERDDLMRKYAEDLQDITQDYYRNIADLARVKNDGNEAVNHE